MNYLYKSLAILGTLTLTLVLSTSNLMSDDALYYEQSEVARALAMVRRLDKGAVNYVVTVSTAQTSRSLDELRNLGFSLIPSGGAFTQLDDSRSRLDFQDILSRSSNVTRQTLRIQAGGQATTFTGAQVPIVTNQPGAQISTMDAGERLTIRAIRALGEDSVEIGVATESSILTSTGPLPAKRQTTSETIVRASLGKPVVLLSFSTSANTGARDRGGSGAIQFKEARRKDSSPLRFGQLFSRRQASFGKGRRRNRRSGTTIVELTVRRAD